MPTKKTYYEILGVPRTATEEQIKRRYRQLVRRHHPDVAQDKAAAKAAFIEIAEAYQTLVNRDRRMIYDTSLDAQMFAAGRPSSAAAKKASSARTHAAGSRVGRVERLVQEAQAAFVHGRFQAAVEACKEAQRLDHRNVRARIILGDICGVRGQIEEAIAMYTIAAQLDPRNADIQEKLSRLARRARPGEAGAQRRAALRLGLNLMGWPAIALMLLLLAVKPGEPIFWLQENLAIVGTWSAMLVCMLLAIGVLGGFLLSVNETVQALDDEIVFQAVRSSGPRAASYPVVLFLIIFNLFSFYLAAAVYIVIGLVQESLSKSVMKALLATFCLVALASLIYWPGRIQVLLFGGNVMFPALLLGWAIGDMFRPAG